MANKALSRLIRPRNLLILAVLGLAMVELAARVHEHLDAELAQRMDAFRSYAESGAHPLYGPHPYTGYGRWTEDANAFGKHHPTGPPGEDQWRIACLGGSTTEGGPTTYPAQLEAQLQALTSRTVQVLNCGVSGWTSAETLVNYQLNIQHLEPHLVIVHHAANDLRPRLFAGFRSDYTHYRRPWRDSGLSCADRFLIGASSAYARLRFASQKRRTIGNWVSEHSVDPELAASTTLDPQTSLPFRRNLRSLILSVRARGAECLLTTMPVQPRSKLGPGDQLNYNVIAEHNQHIRALSAEYDVPLVDMAQWFESNSEASRGAFIDTVHTTKLGHQLKANLIARKLSKLGKIPQRK